jgi:hypothetical protein
MESESDFTRNEQKLYDDNSKAAMEIQIADAITQLLDALFA